MELDDLKREWQALDRKLDRSIALNTRLLVEDRARRSKRHLLWWLIWQPLQLLTGIALAFYLGAFWSRNLGSPAVLLSGVCLHALSIAFALDAVVRMWMIGRISYTAPVVTIQRHLAELRRWEVRSFKVFWLLFWLASPALLIVVVKAFTGIDLWERWPYGVTWTAIGGLAGAAVSYLFDRLIRGSRLAAGLESLYAGDPIARAQAALNEVEAFVREET
jgi:serine/threonine-protein kinase